LSSAINAEVDSAVKSLFFIKDYFVTEDGAAEYKVEYDKSTSGRNFLRLLDSLKGSDYYAQLYGDPQDATLVILKKEDPSTGPRVSAIRLSLHAFLFLVTILGILIIGYAIAVVYPRFVPGSSTVEIELEFSVSVIAVLLARLLAQSYAGRRGGFSNRSYYIPSVPLVVAIPTMYFLPTFGSVGITRSLPANVNKLFDYYFLGSLAIVLVGFLVALLGAGSSIVLTQAQYSAISTGNQTINLQTNPSLIQSGVVALAQSAGVMPRVPPNGVMVFSPVEIAAWLALLLAFLSLMPAALFDGGRMARLALGDGGSRITTIISCLFLLLTDFPNYSVILLVVFFMTAFPTQLDTLDSISSLSSSRKALFALAVILAILCVPLPQSVATIPL
jgi:membrane-associated protease RseP (regulator of RpoE activity)